MKMHRRYDVVFTIFLLLLVATVRAQDSTAEKKLTLNGYIKDLQSLTFDEGFSNLVSGNLIHHRLNMKWKPSGTFTTAIEFRNRLFWGEEVKVIPDFASRLRNEQELVNLSKTWINREVVLHTNTERLWLEYHRPQWELRVGRQRINWGFTTLWNPNDLFNTYNFLDFDYEERPGADAVKALYHFKRSTTLESAVAFQDSGRSVGAVKLFANRGGYDLQGIAGWYHKSLVVGGGWAGSIKEAGFKGELMYFAPDDSGGHFNAALESDYVFAGNWYGNIGGLYNSEGLNHPVENWKQLDFELSPRNLLPAKWTASLMVSKEFTPLFTGNMSVVYSPGVNMLILLPSLRYNLVTNLDVDLVWQSFFAQEDHRFKDQAHRAYLRLKWSY